MKFALAAVFSTLFGLSAMATGPTHTTIQDYIEGFNGRVITARANHDNIKFIVNASHCAHKSDYYMELEPLPKGHPSNAKFAIILRETEAVQKKLKDEKCVQGFAAPTVPFVIDFKMSELQDPEDFLPMVGDIFILKDYKADSKITYKFK